MTRSLDRLAPSLVSGCRGMTMPLFSPEPPPFCSTLRRPGAAAGQHVELVVADEQHVRRLDVHPAARQPHRVRRGLGRRVLAGHHCVELQTEAGQDQLHALAAVPSHQTAPEVASIHPRQKWQDAVHRLGRLGGSRLVPLQDRFSATPLGRRKAVHPLQDKALGITENLPLDRRKIQSLVDDDSIHIEQNAPDRHHRPVSVLASRHERTDARIAEI